MKAWYERYLEKNKIPDSLIRFAIGQQLKNKLKIENREGEKSQQLYFQNLLKALSQGPIAINTRDANEQHYEVPTEFYRLVLGPRLKYSSGYWPHEKATFEESEVEMLKLYSDRAQLQNGQKMLELGCGWGSLSLYLAETYSDSEIVGVSNSSTQKIFIETQIKERGLKNLKIITCDINEFDLDKKFDRVLSIEMFEHMRNYKKLFKKTADLLNDEGLLFVHVFSHKKFAYPYESDNPNNWMARYFFTGGMMPSEEIFCYFQEDMNLQKRWRVNGQHYQKTCEAWLGKMDLNEDQVMSIFKKTYGASNALKWWVYWRIFFMACAELFGYEKGNQWAVTHYLFSKQLKSSSVISPKKSLIC